MKQEKQLYPDEYRQLHDHLQELNVNPHDSVSIITPPFRFHYNTPDGSGQQKKAGEGLKKNKKKPGYETGFSEQAIKNALFVLTMIAAVTGIVRLFR